MERIRWNNLIAFAMAIVAFWVAVKLLPEIRAFLATMRDLGPGHDPDDRTLGLIAVGLLGAVLVAIVRILVSSNRKD